MMQRVGGVFSLPIFLVLTLGPFWPAPVRANDPPAPDQNEPPIIFSPPSEELSLDERIEDLAKQAKKISGTKDPSGYLVLIAPENTENLSAPTPDSDALAQLQPPQTSDLKYRVVMSAARFTALGIASGISTSQTALGKITHWSSLAIVGFVTGAMSGFIQFHSKVYAASIDWGKRLSPQIRPDDYKPAGQIGRSLDDRLENLIGTDFFNAQNQYTHWYWSEALYNLILMTAMASVGILPGNESTLGLVVELLGTSAAAIPVQGSGESMAVNQQSAALKKLALEFGIDLTQEEPRDGESKEDYLARVRAYASELEKRLGVQINSELSWSEKKFLQFTGRAPLLSNWLLERTQAGRKIRVSFDTKLLLISMISVGMVAWSLADGAFQMGDVTLTGKQILFSLAFVLTGHNLLWAQNNALSRKMRQIVGWTRSTTRRLWGKTLVRRCSQELTPPTPPKD